MKKITALALACLLLFLSAVSLAEEGARFVTVREWLDAKGECGNCMLLLKIRRVLNPVVAVAADETGEVNLFSGSEKAADNGGMIINFMDGTSYEGAALVIANPRYNEFEGNVELADWDVLRLVGEPWAGDFTFNNGLTWGMSLQEVKDREGDDTVESESNGFSTLHCDRELYGRRANLQYFFKDDSLKAAQYGLDLGEGEMQELEQQISEDYGVPVQTSRNEFVALCIYMGVTETDGVLPQDEGCYYKWLAAGNTRVLGFRAAEDYFFLVLASPETDQ